MKYLIVLSAIILFSIIPLVYAQTQIPFWVDERLHLFANDKITSKLTDQVFYWLAEQNKIILKTNNEQKISPEFKNLLKDWDKGKISDQYFYEKLYHGLKDGSIQPSSKTIFNKNDYKEIQYSGHSPLFKTFAYSKDFTSDQGKYVPNSIQFEKRDNQTKNYQRISSSGNDTVVIKPIFTSSAYYEPGFYTYYRGECNKNCLTTSIKYGYPYGFSASANSNKIFRLLNYTEISDIDVDKNPQILSKFNKVILLHNEYVTEKEFNAIIKHPKVLYLYPNALYGKISVDYNKNTITLIKGHGFPDKTISNGFNWKYDNSNLEYNTDCNNWNFTKISNGKQLNCYPTNIIFRDFELLKQIKDY